MKVKDLIRVLQTMPPEASVTHLWDGEARTNIEHVWLAREGFVVTSDFGEVCYSTGTLPDDALIAKEDRYWQTPKNPNTEFDEL